MARTLAALPEGSRITDYISLGVITKTIPLNLKTAVSRFPARDFRGIDDAEVVRPQRGSA